VIPLKKILIMDGAMGTELQKRGVEVSLPLWSANANIEFPEIVKDIHKDYVDAGSDVITTNTFRSTFWTYRKAGYSDRISRELAKKGLYSAVNCAQDVVKNSIKILGSITSVDDCYLPQNFPGKSIAEDTYGYALEWLSDAGVDIFLFETMGNIIEIKCALDIAQSYDKPLWLSIIMKDKNHLLDDTHIEKLFQIIKEYRIDYLLNNCNQIDTTISVLKSFLRFWDGYWGVYPNLGNVDYKNEYFEIIDKSKFHNALTSIVSLNPDIIGLCCGSSPGHLVRLKKILKT
tara:strand:- start:1217 stop:2080 length:864 start_codon:yes stop_codon:yes gene_type:complete